MTDDKIVDASRARNTRDDRGRWVKGHCPNPKGRPKKERFEDYNPSDIRHFLSTQIEVATAEGVQMMDRRTAFQNKVFECAMKGKATQTRMMKDMIDKNDRELAELRLEYDKLLHEWILDNPDFKTIDDSLTLQQRTHLFGMATTLNHYYPGQYGALLGEVDDKMFDSVFEELRAKRAQEADDLLERQGLAKSALVDV